jgi:hypothetical protein
MKHFIFKILTVALLFFTVNGYSQLENSYWYFGYKAGLNFNNNNTTVLSDGETEYDDFSTVTVSNTNGELLFYTDGRSVWNKNHVKMPYGNNSMNGSQRTVSVVPFPGDINKYYIFTIGIIGTEYRYYYSIVDMSLDNNLGNIIQNTLNTPLGILPYIDSDFNIKSEMQRKNNMVVAKHSDGESYWLILNPFDVFFTIKIDTNGISTPIAHNENIPSLNYNSNIRGTSGLSISPNFDKISYYTHKFNGGGSSRSSAFTILNFDNSNGQISLHFFTIDDPNFHILGGDASEFSENGNYLYLLTQNTDTNYWIYQFDLQNLNTPPIFLDTTLGGNADSDSPTLVRGIDGKIYVPNSSNILGVINNPNNSGTACNYINNQINLGTNVDVKKLPQQIYKHLDNIIDCPQTLIITETINNGEVDIEEAASWIKARNIIQANADAEYDAKKFVKLEAGFQAKAGSHFKAYIDGCDISTPPTSSSKNFINNISTNSFISIFPNPAYDQVNLSSKNEKIQSYILRDINGRSVQKNNNINSNIYSIDTSQLLRGFYIIEINLVNNTSFTKKIILR